MTDSISVPARSLHWRFVTLLLLFAALCLRADDASSVDFTPLHFEMKIPVKAWKLNRDQLTDQLTDPWSVASVVVGGGFGSLLALHQVAKYSDTHREEIFISIGQIICPKTVIASACLNSGAFSTYRVSLPYVLKPNFGNCEDLKKHLDAFRLDLEIKSGTNSNLAFIDILPNTTFVDASIKGSITASAKIGVSQSGNFVIAQEDASAGLVGLFTWSYSPKDIAVISGTVGNTGFIEFKPRTDGAYHVGQVPIEMTILTPSSTREGELVIVNTISNNGRLIPCGSANVRILFPSDVKSPTAQDKNAKDQSKR